MTTLFFRTRLNHGGYKDGVKIGHGVYVGLKVWYGQPIDPVTGEELDRSPRWQAIRNGHEIEIDLVSYEYYWLNRHLPPMVRGEPISEAEFDFYEARNAYAREHEPESPEACPRDAIDLNKMSTIF